MKINNKGFAISSIMYMILIMAVVLITLTLSLLSSRKLILDKSKKEALDNIYNTFELSYRETLEILKSEAVLYAYNNNIESGSVKVNELNSSVSLEILSEYELLNKSLIITYNNDTYDISLQI